MKASEARSGTVRLIASVALLGLAALSAPGPVSGQESLRDLVSQLFVFGECGEPLCLDFDYDAHDDLLLDHGKHYLPALEAGNAAILAFVNGAVAKAVTNIPIVSTGPGSIDYTNSDLDTVIEQPSLGSVFGERGETLLKGRFFLGMNANVVHLTNFSGVPADNLILNFAHEDREVQPSLGTPLFEADLLQVQLGMDMTMVVATAVMTYGLTERMDVGLALPFVRTTLDGRSEAQILPFDQRFPHRFAAGDSLPVLRAAQSVTGKASGIGDIAARVKLNLWRTAPPSGDDIIDRTPSAYFLGFLGDVRFATGDEADFLGAGSGSVRALGVLSARYGSFAPHVNAGYLFRSGDLDNDAILATVGWDNRVTQWATIAVDLVTEWQVGESKLTVPQLIQFDDPLGTRIPATAIPDRRQDLIDVSIGAKIRLPGGAVLVANSLIPAREAGYRPDAIWTLGLEWLR